MSAESEVRLGSILLSLVEPRRGFEVAFHRWYERDHFYAGCMIGPWLFAGRRWVATRDLKKLRSPAQTPVTDDVAKGSYLVTYWIHEGHHDEFVRWAVTRVHALRAAGRMFDEADQVHTSFYAYCWGVSRDADGVPPELALDHPFAGLVAAMIDRNAGVEAERLDRWYREEHLPGALAGSSAALCLAFHPLPLPEGAPLNVPRTPGGERRSLHLYFLERDPRDGWDATFAGHADALATSGLGELAYLAPFIPTLPGSDRYTDELW